MDREHYEAALQGLPFLPLQSLAYLLFSYVKNLFFKGRMEFA
jgi:hypothetical protein